MRRVLQVPGRERRGEWCKVSWGRVTPTLSSSGYRGERRAGEGRTSLRLYYISVDWTVLGNTLLPGHELQSIKPLTNTNEMHSIDGYI